MIGRMIAFGLAFATLPALAAAQATVRVETPQLNGPRALAPQTAQAVVRDYLQSWKAMRAALEQNQPGLLNADFIGAARDKLSKTIQEQAAAGIHTRYQDRAHDLQIVFYSPEGLSIELTDTVDYDVQVFDADKLLTSQPVHARYLIMMTPSQVRWRVRGMQAGNP
jgi:hypothetical protein